MKPWMRIVFLSALSSAALYYGTACGSSEDEPVDPALADVILQGSASAKALKALVGATAKEDPEKGAVIDYPPNDTEIPASPIATFKWHLLGATAALPRLDPAPPSLLPADSRLWPRQGAFAELTGPLRELLGPEREAHAETAVMSGAGYFLEFSADGLPNVLRVFTTKTSYTPDMKAWEKLYAVNAWTTLVIRSASFDDDSLSPKSGPFLSPHVAFCIMR